MRKTLILLVGMGMSLALMQTASAADNADNNNGQVTVRGCVTKQAGDYVLMKDNPGNTYELQGTKGIRLSSYLGQRVEVRGTKSTTMATSSDEGDREGAGSPVTITVKSIKTIAKECEAR